MHSLQQHETLNSSYDVLVLFYIHWELMLFIHSVDQMPKGRTFLPGLSKLSTMEVFN